MKKRILIAVILFISLILIAKGGVWANKLQIGNETPDNSPSEVGARPAGTGASVDPRTKPLPPPYVPPPTVYVIELIEDSEEIPEGGPEGVIYFRITFGEEGVAVSASNITTIPIKVFIENDNNVAWYWDGAEWVEIVIGDNGRISFPVGTPNPVILAIVEDLK